MDEDEASGGHDDSESKQSVFSSKRGSLRRLSRESSEMSKQADSITIPQKPGGCRHLKYPVQCFVSQSPALALPVQPHKEWQARVERANKTAGCQTTSGPVLLWYGCELQRVCAQSLLASADQVIKLQSHLTVKPGHWEAGGQLWPLLLQSSTQFSAVSYVVEKVSGAILSKDDTEACEHEQVHEDEHEHEQGSADDSSTPAARMTLLRARCFQTTKAKARPLLWAWLQPRTADEAMADMQAQISRLQAAGLPLSVLLRRLQAAELLRLLEDEALVEQLFFVVPCLELAVVRLQHLTAFAMKIQEDEQLLLLPPAAPDEHEAQEGGLGFSQELSHEVEEVVEAGKLLEALPGEVPGGEPAEVGATAEREDAQQQPDSKQEGDSEEASTPTKSASKSSSLSRSLKKVRTQKIVTAKSKPKR